MECHEGATMIKTFRGRIADGGQDTINLHTNDGKTGYRIVKFELFSTGPATVRTESTVKIYNVPQTSVDGAVDFSDTTLLGVAYLGNYQQAQYPTDTVVVFDTEIFNQDIYITHDGGDADSSPINYYIELEQVSLDVNASTVATLQSIRTNATGAVVPP